MERILITLNHQMESLSRAYIQAIAGRCGMMCSRSEFDYGIDVKVLDVSVRMDQSGDQTIPRYIESGFVLGFQAKSTTNVMIEDATVAYDLDVKAYNDLRDQDAGEPRFLVLLVLPDDDRDWLSISEEQLILRRCAYWCSLKGQPATSNTATIRIRIPRINLFDVNALRTLMERRKNGDEL